MRQPPLIIDVPEPPWWDWTPLAHYWNWKDLHFWNYILYTIRWGRWAPMLHERSHIPKNNPEYPN